jgi:DNA-binding response OmpR family regulator
MSELPALNLSNGIGSPKQRILLAPIEVNLPQLLVSSKVASAEMLTVRAWRSEEVLEGKRHVHVRLRHKLQPHPKGFQHICRRSIGYRFITKKKSRTNTRLNGLEYG